MIVEAIKRAGSVAARDGFAVANSVVAVARCRGIAERHQIGSAQRIVSEQGFVLLLHAVLDRNRFNAGFVATCVIRVLDAIYA